MNYYQIFFFRFIFHGYADNSRVRSGLDSYPILLSVLDIESFESDISEVEMAANVKTAHHIVYHDINLGLFTGNWIRFELLFHSVDSYAGGAIVACSGQ